MYLRYYTELLVLHISILSYTIWSCSTGIFACYYY